MFLKKQIKKDAEQCLDLRLTRSVCSHLCLKGRHMKSVPQPKIMEFIGVLQKWIAMVFTMTTPSGDTVEKHVSVMLVRIKGR